jgi:hypothetical protein
VRNKRRLIGRLAVLIVACGLTAARATDSVDFAAANALYNEGDFRGAIDAYEKIEREGFRSAELYYNLGNALEKADRPLDAILSYRRALALDPGLRSARNNLTLAAAENQAPLSGPTWQDDLTRFVHPETLIVAGSAAAWVGAFGLIFAIFLRGRKVAAVLLSALIFVGGNAAFALGYVTDPRIADASTAMVMAREGVVPRSTPVVNSTKLGRVQAGALVGVLSTRGNWTYCVLPDGSKGWVDANSVAMLVPEDPATPTGT